MTSLHLLNQYSNNNHSNQKDKKSKRLSNHKNNPKPTLDRPLPRALPPGNFNISYDTFEVRIPNYIFGKAVELAGAGGLIAISIGKRIKDDKVVLAKISPQSVRLEREYYVTRRLYSLPGGNKYVLNAIEYVSLVQDGLAALLYTDVQPSDCVYFQQDHKIDYYTLYSLCSFTTKQDIWTQDLEPLAKSKELTLDAFLNFAVECCSALQFLHENGVIHGELRPSAFQYVYNQESQSFGAKVWNFGDGLHSYEELLLTTSRWKSFMSNDNSNPSNSSSANTSIPIPPPPPPPPRISHKQQSKQQQHFPFEQSNSTSNSNALNSYRFYSPKEVQTSLAYVSPEQTGRTSNALDHRADLYSLGIMFFTFLADRPPFEGTAMDVIHAILSKNVPLVHTLRRDIPPVISLIIDKLTRKTVDERYDSVYGVREDLLECQKRLAGPKPAEALVYFQLGLRDVNPVFKVSDSMYGRKKESELIRSLIEHTYNVHQQEKRQVRSQQQQQQHQQEMPDSITTTMCASMKGTMSEKNAGVQVSSPAMNDETMFTKENTPLKEANSLRVNASTSLDHTMCEVIVIKGPGGIGKSTLISTLNVQARHCGYTAVAKFDKNQKRPYNGLLKCLSLILRQLLTESENVIREFYKDLKHNLGPQFSNVRLMVSMVPELKPILYDYRERVSPPDDDALLSILNTETRFHAVFLNIIRTIAKKKLLTLCLDDLQEADDASIHLISALVYSRTTMMVILTFRDGDDTPQKIVDILDKCDNPVTTIQLHPLPVDILKELVLDTIYKTHRSSAIMQYHGQNEEKQQRLETITSLVEIMYSWTHGNPFYAKQFLKTMKRKDDIWFDWNEKHWKFRLDNIKKLFDTKAQSNTTKNPTNISVNNELLILGGAGAEQNNSKKPHHQHYYNHHHHHHHHHNQPVFDVRNLVSHLRSLDLSAQQFLMWASLIGHVFNFRRIKWLMMASPHSSDTLGENYNTASNHNCIALSQASDEGNINTKNAYKTGSDASTSAYMLTFEEEEKRSNHAMLGLQIALNEGIIQYKAGNEFQFIHDRYYQAASMLIGDPAQCENMHLKIGQMLMLEEEVEEDDGVFLTADHVLKSAALIRLIDKRRCYRNILTRAGNEATLSGAIQISATYYKCAFSLLDEDIEKRWTDGPDTSFEETLNIYMKLLELKLLNNKNTNHSNLVTTEDEEEDSDTDDEMIAATFTVQDEERDSMMKQIMEHTKDRHYERAQAWRIQARIYFQQSQYRKGISNILEGLEELGIVVDTTITEEQVLDYYRAVKPSITKPGFEILMKAGPCQNTKQMAIMTLLNEACTGAYWVNPTLVDFFALKLCELSLKYGYTPSSGVGFIWVGCTATRVSEFSFAAQLGKFGMAISEKYAGNSEIARAIIVHHTMLAQWTGVHVREYIYQYQRAYKYAIAGGDTLYSSMALFHVATTLYWTNCNLSELHWHLNHSMDECSKGTSKDVLILNISLWRSVLVLQGKTDTMDPEKMMNDPDSNFDEPSFVEDLKTQSVNTGNPLNWHYSFKMILLIHFGFNQLASDLGFKIFDNSVNESVHRHVGIAMYYHCVALVESLRNPNLDPEIRLKYETQLYNSEKRLNELATHSEVNYRMYHKTVQAQISTLDPNGLSKTLHLYDEVIELALKGNWYAFLGFIFELASAHYIRCGLTMLAAPTLLRSIKFYSRWGAFGKVQYLKKKYSKELASQMVAGAEDAAVQTEDVIVGLTTTVVDKNFSVWDANSHDETTPDSSLKELYEINESQQISTETNGNNNEGVTSSSDDGNVLKHEDTLFSLDMVDLTSIIKSSQVISNEMNSFDELLKKMMGIIMANSGAESGAIIIKEGVFGIVAYSDRATDTCLTYEPPFALQDDNDKISTSIVHYVIHTQSRLFISNVEADSRFSTGDAGMKKGAVICMPIMHKSTLVGVLYLQANLNAFTYKHANVLTLLCDQIGISITNALLFKSVQKATKDNALMIESQLKALEEARASREQALRATKMKSNFLANMSHELRTPFSGFYGMISLLNETRLDVEQREFVSIAKQSCEMLLHIIDDLLDFSKLEAHKVKLLHGLFYIEDLIADRMELLITLATNKNVELSYFIDDDVPSIVYGDGNRIGQILMNLIGNAIKFTHHGEVIVRCGVVKDDDPALMKPGSITLKVSVQDTGIGMSEDEIKGLFLPFSQVDSSTTRNFGGTGLGLSICLQLVKLMHGDIHVNSVVNEGSTFVFTIRVKNGSTVTEPDSGYDSRYNTIDELRVQLGQPRILVIGLERTKLTIQSFIPWIEHLEHRTTAKEGIDSLLTSAVSGTPYDCIIMDSPQPDVLMTIINTIENTPILKQTRILLLLSPIVDNIRRHFAHSTVTAHGDSVNHLIEPNDHLQHRHVFHHLVTRLSKPVRTIKLLNALVNVMSKPTIELDEKASESASTALEKNHSVSSNHNAAVENQNLQLDSSEEKVKQAQSDNKAILVTPPYSRKSQETFSPEELALFKGQRILVAEDNFIAQRLIVKQLERLGFIVEKCNNGLECVDTWKSRGAGYFLLAWIDHHMPKCDGLEATRKIRLHEKLMKWSPALPIIALTADIQLTAQTNCINAGMNDYVTKPLMQKDLTTILRKYCLGPITL